MAKKPTTPKAPKPNKLEPLKVNLQTKPVKNGDVLTLRVDGDYASRFNTASAIAKEAAKLMTDLKAIMQPEAIAHIFDHNVASPWDCVTSVALQDDENNVTRVSNTAKFGEISEEAAESLFDSLRKRDGSTPNVNDYLAHTVVADFDSSVFQTAEGKFDEERYTAIVEALDKVCAELGAKNPLSSRKVIKPLPSFASRRWVDFDKSANLKISRVIPNQINFTPCPNAVTGKLCGQEDEDAGK